MRQFVLSQRQRRRRGLFFCNQVGRERAETDEPAFEDQDFYGGRRGGVDEPEGAGGDAVAVAGVQGFVVGWYGSWGGG